MKLDIKRLKAERIAKGLSQEDMAYLMGWKSRTPYVKRELGIIDIGVDEFLKMIKILGYTEDNISIFFKEDVPEREQKEWWTNQMNSLITNRLLQDRRKEECGWRVIQIELTI